MIRTVSAAVTVAMLVLAGAASAGDVKGTIKAIDATKKTITLEDGKVYTFPNPNVITGYSTGQVVTIMFTVAGTTNNGETVTIFTK